MMVSTKPGSGHVGVTDDAESNNQIFRNRILVAVVVALIVAVGTVKREREGFSGSADLSCQVHIWIVISHYMDYCLNMRKSQPVSTPGAPCR